MKAKITVVYVTG